jgi:hypothetical protein
VERARRERRLVSAVGAAALVGSVWLMGVVSSPWDLVIWYAIFIAMGVATWITTGQSVAGVLAWMVPLLVAWTLVAMRPTLVAVLGLLLLAAAPMLGRFVPPIGRLVHLYMRGVGDWILRRSVVGEDGRTWRRLRAAIEGTDQLRADARRVENVRLVIATQRRHADLILAVPAPDAGWARAIRAAAAPRILYRQMLEGYRRLDYDLMAAEVASSNREVMALVASRSTLYRVLSLRFEWEPRPIAHRR